MKRALVILLLLISIPAFVAWGIRAFASDEDKILRCIDELIEAANEGDLADLREGLSLDFEDESGVDREGLMSTLRPYFVHAQLNGFTYEAQLDLDDAVVILESDEDATVNGGGRLARRKGGRSIWEFSFEFQMRKDDGEWLLAHSRFDTTDGKRPF